MSALCQKPTSPSRPGRSHSHVLLKASVGGTNDRIAWFRLLLRLSGAVDGVRRFYFDSGRTTPRYGQTALAISCANYQIVYRTWPNGHRIRHAGAYAGYLRDKRESCMEDIQRNNARRLGTLAYNLSNPPKSSGPRCKVSPSRLRSKFPWRAGGYFSLFERGWIANDFKCRSASNCYSLRVVLCDGVFFLDLCVVFTGLVLGFKLQR
jgi:hypothetical protein